MDEYKLIRIGFGTGCCSSDHLNKQAFVTTLVKSSFYCTIVSLLTLTTTVHDCCLCSGNNCVRLADADLHLRPHAFDLLLYCMLVLIRLSASYSCVSLRTPTPTQADTEHLLPVLPATPVLLYYFSIRCLLPSPVSCTTHTRSTLHYIGYSTKDSTFAWLPFSARPLLTM